MIRLCYLLDKESSRTIHPATRLESERDIEVFVWGLDARRYYVCIPEVPMVLLVEFGNGCATSAAAEIWKLMQPPSREPFQQMFSGKIVNIVNPKLEDIDLTDILVGMSREPRYRGQTKFPYSVGQHTLLLIDAMKMHSPATLEDLQRAFLHDASEVYLGDVNGNWKKHHSMLNYQLLESKFNKLIAQKFGMKSLDSELVHEFDLRMLVTEKEQIMYAGGVHWPYTIDYDPIPNMLIEPCSDLDVYRNLVWMAASLGFRGHDD